MVPTARGIEVPSSTHVVVDSLIEHATDAQAVEIIRGIGQKFLDTSPEHRMSAQQDVLRGSRLEYQETLGYALQKARELNVPMPTLDICYRIISVAHP
jgi:ketopantoate reductase